MYLNTTPIPQANEVKYLGIHMEKRLTWQSHKKKTAWPETAVHVLASVQYIKVVFREQAINLQSNAETDLDIRHSTLRNCSNI